MPRTIMEAILPDFMNWFFQDFMAFPIFSNHFFEIHLGWSLIHLLAGFLIMYLLMKKKSEKPFLTAILILFTFEVFEFVVSYVLPIILRETFIDTFFDLWIGVAGIIIAWFIFRKRESVKY